MTSPISNTPGTPNSTPAESPRGVLPRSTTSPDLGQINSLITKQSSRLSKSDSFRDPRQQKIVAFLDEMFACRINVKNKYELLDLDQFNVTISGPEFKDLSASKQADVIELVNRVATYIQVHKQPLYEAIQVLEKNEDFRASKFVRAACIQYV